MGGGAARTVLPGVEHLAEGVPAYRARAGMQQAGAAQVQHHLRHAAGGEHVDGGVADRAVGQRVHQPRRAAVNARPVLHRRDRQAGGVRHGGQVQQQVGGAAERGVHHHGVVQCLLGEQVAGAQPGIGQRHQRQRGTARHVQPHRFAGGRQGGMRQAQAEPFRHHLGGGRGAQELAAAAGAAARPAAHGLGVLQADQAVRETRADGLYQAGVLGIGRRQGDAAGHDDARLGAQAGHRQQHGRQPLVAGGHPQHAAAGRQRARQAAHHQGGVVAVRQAVEHARRALSAAVARVGTERRERDAATVAQGVGGGLHQQPYFPVAGVQAERDRRSVRSSDPALRAEDHERRPRGLLGAPAHGHVVGQSEQVAARLLAQHLGGDRQRPFRGRAHGAQPLIGAAEPGEAENLVASGDPQRRLAIRAARVAAVRLLTARRGVWIAGRTGSAH